MVKAILGVIVGYLVMAVVLFAVFTGFYLAIGTERAFQPASYDPSMLWNVATFVVGLVAAIMGGLVCRKIAGRTGPVKVFAGVVLVLGLMMAASIAMQPALEGEAAVRPGALSNMDAMQQARTPLWSAIANPFVGVLGVLIGGGVFVKPKAA